MSSIQHSRLRYRFHVRGGKALAFLAYKRRIEDGENRLRYIVHGRNADGISLSALCFARSITSDGEFSRPYRARKNLLDYCMRSNQVHGKLAT
jgi:hypothetical protein